MVTASYVQRMLPRMQRYGSTLALQARTLAIVFQRATVDMSETLGPTLLLAQAAARAMDTVVAHWLRDDGFNALPLDQQAALGLHATHWGDLRTTLENLAIQRRVPAISALEHATASAAAFGASAQGVALGVKLEEILFTADHVVTFEKFWAVQPASLTAIGRLVASDPVLTLDLTVDVTSEVIAILDGCVPLAPDTTTILNEIEAARPDGVRSGAPPQTQMWTMKDGDTLEQIAGSVLGNPDLWRQIAAYNTLRYPYFSNDPVVQYGDLVTEKTTAAETGIGATTLTLTSTFSLSRDQRIVFKTITGAQVVSIESIDDVANTCEVTPAFTAAFPSGTVVQVYPPAYEVTSKVLQTGQTLLIPLPAMGRQNLTILQRTEGTSEEHVYGIDVLTTEQGYLAIGDDGDLMLARGRSNLVQALRNRMSSAKGSLIHHPEYGFAVVNFLGQKHRPFLEFLALVEAHQVAYRDPRVESVEDFRVSAKGDTIEVEFTTVTTIQDRFPVTATTPLRVMP